MVEAAPAVSVPISEMNPHANEYYPVDGLDSRIRKAQSKAAKRSGGHPGKKSWKFMAPQVQGGGSQPQQQQSSLLPENLLGNWADSLGNSVLVFSVDAYEVRLCATLSQPPRPDITLKIQPAPGGGWICGNAMLDPMWSTVNQLHWLTTDGRISVWVRPEKGNAMATATSNQTAMGPTGPSMPPGQMTGQMVQLGPTGPMVSAPGPEMQSGDGQDKDMW